MLSCALATAGAACSSSSPASEAGATAVVTAPSAPSSTGDAVQKFPDIVDAVATPSTGDGSWTFDVTVSSPYDSPERYADGWRILGPDDAVLGEYTLTHDHASEQPFTRTQSGVEIPADVHNVTIEGRDQANGYGGTTFPVELPSG